MLKLPGHSRYAYSPIVERKDYRCVEHKHKDRVWYTRAGDIAKYCFSLPKGLIPGSD
jgi:hypothetical protein